LYVIKEQLLAYRHTTNEDITDPYALHSAALDSKTANINVKNLPV